MKKECDVVVVGAGPAGSIAAKFLAEKGVDVLVVEKKQEIGPPKRCAEGINIQGLEKVGLKPNPRWAVNEIRGVVMYAPSFKSVEMKFGFGYILERKIFEKFLAEEAIKKGARYMVKTHATGVIKKGGKIVGVKAEYMGEELEINAKIVIAADGVDSKIARSAGLNTQNKLTDYHSGFQYEMAGLKNVKKDMLHIYFGNDVAPKGYVWIFPKNDNVANVGIGILGKYSEDGKRAKDYLDKFISKHPEIFETASPIEINTGGVPVSSSVETFVTDGLMVIGDAAQQVNPIHGGGIAIAMNAGKIAAEVAAKAIKEGDFSRERLYEYEKIWRSTNGKKMEKLLRLRNFLEKLGDDDFERFAEILTGADIVKLTEADYGYLLKTVITKFPKLMPMATKFLT